MMRYEILGSVFSGDCDTTLCNTLRMALYNIFINEKAGLQFGKDYIVISKGDDFTVFYKPYIENEFIRKIYYRYFLKTANEYEVYGLGQVLKMLNIGDPTSLSFCSLRAYPINVCKNQIILVRNPHKFLTLSKYSRKIKAMSFKQRVEYYFQQAVSLRAAYPGIVIFDTMAEAYEQQAMKLINYNPIAYKLILKKVNSYLTEIRKSALEIDPKYVETPEYQQMYGIQFKRRFFKIQENYWDTMKMLQESQVEKLSTEELKYVNEAIENEISLEYFKSIMGLNKLSYNGIIQYQKF
jgi:hypothetical protein